MKIQALLAAALLTTAAVPAFAESEVSLGYQHYTADALDESENGVGLRYSGDYANGVEANLDIYTGSDDGVDVLAYEADLSWKWQDLIGPKVSHYAVSVDGLGVDTTYAGVTVGKEFGAFSLGADALTNIRGIDDSQIYAVRAGWAATDALELSAEIRHETFADTTVGTIGAKYDVRENVFVQGEYTSGQTIGFEDGDAAFVGVGFRF